MLWSRTIRALLFPLMFATPFADCPIPQPPDASFSPNERYELLILEWDGFQANVPDMLRAKPDLFEDPVFLLSFGFHLARHGLFEDALAYAENTTRIVIHDQCINETLADVVAEYATNLRYHSIQGLLSHEPSRFRNLTFGFVPRQTEIAIGDFATAYCSLALSDETLIISASDQDVEHCRDALN